MSQIGRTEQVERTEQVGRSRPVEPVRQAAALLWSNLPVLLAGSVVVVLAAAVVRVIAPVSGVLAVLGSGLLVLPALAALVRGAQVMVADEAFGVADLVRALLRGYGPTAALAAAPMIALSLADVASVQWIAYRQSWMMISLGLCLAVSGIALVLAVIALPYQQQTRSPLVDCWRVAAYVATRRPVPVLAVLSAFVLLGWTVSHASLALMIIFPGPLALLWAVAAGSATTDCRRLLHPARS